MTGIAGLSNLQQRALSAVVLIVLALLLTWWGGVWYRLLCVVIGGAVFFEWFSITAPAEMRTHKMVAGVLLAVVMALLLAGLPVVVLLMALFAALIVGALHAAYERRGYWPVSGLIYAGLPAIALAALRGSDSAGLAATLFLFAIVWATDILAYFVGRAIGGPKLAPTISPGKTWSGAIGGAVAGVVAGLVVALQFGASAGMAVMIAVAFALSVVSQLGDLFESRLKRVFGVKDSGRLIPGHGGVMDRVDGLVAAAVALLLLGALVASPDAPAQAFFGR